jgi:hypothetical protein
MNAKQKTSPELGGHVTRVAVVLLLLFEGLPRLYFALSGMVPAGHDGLQRFYLQEFFFSGVTTTGEMPAWLPYLSQGTVASWWAAICGSAGLSLFSFFGNLWSNESFLYLFWLSDALDRFIFAIGLALYLQYFLRNEFSAWATALLATFTISDVIQPWYNFRIFFLLPLIFLFLHLLLDKKNVKILAAIGVLFVWQVYCGLPYFAILLSFLVFLYFLCVVLSQPRKQFANIICLFKKPVSLGSAAILCLLFAGLFYLLIGAGTDQVRNFNPGRSNDGSVTLVTFLNYANIPRFTNWLELIAGISPCVDYTLFLGAGVLGLILAGIWPAILNLAVVRAVVCFLILAYLFSIGSFVSTLSYYFWPGMKLMRHISLIAPLLKIPLLVLVGFGISNLLSRDPKTSKRSVGICLLSLFVCAGFAYWSATTPVGLRFWEEIMGENKVQPHPILSAAYIAHAGFSTVIWSILLIFILGMGTFVLRKTNLRRLFLYLFLAFTVVGGFIFRLERDFAGMASLAGTSDNVMPRRNLDFNNRRHLNLFDGNEPLQTATAKKILWDSRFRYWSENLFWRQEEVTSTFRIDHWLASYDGILRIFEGEPFDSPLPPPGFRAYRGMISPIDPLFYSISGVTQDKARLYDNVTWCERSTIAETMRLSRAVDENLVLLTDKPIYSNVVGSKKSSIHSTGNQDVKNISFSANHAAFRANVANPGGAWLFYSDAWHPNWSATMDGSPAPIERAFYGYKAVHVPFGISAVEFNFRLPYYQAAHFIFRFVGATLALIVIAFSIIGLFYGHIAWELFDNYLREN